MMEAKPSETILSGSLQSRVGDSALFFLSRFNTQILENGTPTRKKLAPTYAEYLTQNKIYMLTKSRDLSP